MAIIAEALVEEWLSRQGYFTIRGLKAGLDEIDILAIRNVNGRWTSLHVEVQVSIRPMRYLTSLSRSRQHEFDIYGGTNAKRRSMDQLKLSTKDWLERKFFSEKKDRIRRQLLDRDWEFMLVHGNVKYPEELKLLQRNKKLKLMKITDIITDLKTKKFAYTTASAGDLIDLMILQTL